MIPTPQYSPSFLPPHIPPPPPIDHSLRSGAVGRPGTSSSSPLAASFTAPPPSRYAHGRDLGSPSSYPSQNQTLSPPSSAVSASSSSRITSPFSSISRSGPNSPQTQYSMAMRSASRGMVVEYNPQQWGSGGPTGGVHIPHSAFPAQSRPANPEDGCKYSFVLDTNPSNLDESFVLGLIDDRTHALTLK